MLFSFCFFHILFAQSEDCKLRECPLCLADLPIEFFPKLISCQHRSCIDCYQQYLRIEISESRVNVTCPECPESLHPNGTLNFHRIYVRVLESRTRASFGRHYATFNHNDIIRSNRSRMYYGKWDAESRDRTLEGIDERGGTEVWVSYLCRVIKMALTRVRGELSERNLNRT